MKSGSRPNPQPKRQKGVSIEELRDRIIRLVQEKPEKAATILAEWLRRDAKKSQKKGKAA